MASVLGRGLSENGYAVDVAPTGEDGLWLAGESRFDAVVLDVMLPGMDGFGVLGELRRAGNWAPVLLLTARDAVGDLVRGLDLGADDYLTKPFAFPELLARLRALIRRGAAARPVVLTVGDLELDPGSREVRRGRVPIALTAKEFAVLECLMRRPGQVLSRTGLTEQVWDFDVSPDSNVVDVYIGYLRSKIDRPFGRASVRTIRGAGYVIQDDTDVAR